MSKIVVYQLFTRLFGNGGKNIPNGTIEQNGCAKFGSFTPKVLSEIKRLGATHVWFTGILEHATQTDYSQFGIRTDHSGVVKGSAGSPYAVKDYYDVDPDLADSVPNRMHEFEQLVQRTHKAGLKMLMDFVPNHVARQYHSDVKPETDFGLHDRKDWHFCQQNNFYYCPNTPFAPQFDAKGYTEFPARATGNDCFSPSPTQNDWYETVKLNYGVDYTGGGATHFDPMPDTWLKMRDILLYWAAKGVDGFRCDMAEMVPAEFWHWAIGEVKKHFPSIIFVAEVYNPALYRRYIFEGGFDYLYDKVGLYDSLRRVMCHQSSAHDITHQWQQVNDIQSHMLNFLENHDEQRIASDFFAGSALAGKPAMLVAACMNTNPVMVYAGQELGERGMDAEGFSGCDGRTTIFDYWSVATLKDWYAGKMSDSARDLRTFYQRLLTLCNLERALSEGAFFDLMYANAHLHEQYAFVRAAGREVILAVANFSENDAEVQINLPQHLFDFLNLQKIENAAAIDLLSGEKLRIDFTSEKPAVAQVAARNGKIVKLGSDY